jgi:glycosyltransferase involved in cell wall biosynthesis
MNPKISIIVPVYKVEQYIHKCIDSILKQTLIDFELILINDGSPDNCGQICEEYARKDARIKVIHKENGGLSSARNAGLDVAKGEYIGFVDSDDWIEPDMYELLYNLCEDNNCEIANISSFIHYKDRTIRNGGHPFFIHNRSEAMKTMLEGKLYDEVVWTKLIKRSLLRDLRFKTGIVYEDTAFTYQLIHKSNRICCIGMPMYHYIKRENSTMDIAIKNIRTDSVKIYHEMYKFMNRHYHELQGIVALKIANSSMTILNLICQDNNYLKFKKEYHEVTNILNSYVVQIFGLKQLPKKVKVILVATKFYPLSYKFLITLAMKRG